ncbi:hypothetical protein QBC44DRAFT_398612, partial [Cladorrhinum sp. PSN332]
LDDIADRRNCRISVFCNDIRGELYRCRQSHFFHQRIRNLSSWSIRTRNTEEKYDIAERPSKLEMAMPKARQRLQNDLYRDDVLGGGDGADEEPNILGGFHGKKLPAYMETIIKRVPEPPLKDMVESMEEHKTEERFDETICGANVPAKLADAGLLIEEMGSMTLGTAGKVAVAVAGVAVAEIKKEARKVIKNADMKLPDFLTGGRPSEEEKAASRRRSNRKDPSEESWYY